MSQSSVPARSWLFAEPDSPLWTSCGAGHWGRLCGTMLGGARYGHSPCHCCVRGKWLRSLLEGLCPSRSLLPRVGGGCPVAVTSLVTHGCGDPVKEREGSPAFPYCPAKVVGGCGRPAREIRVSCGSNCFSCPPGNLRWLSGDEGVHKCGTPWSRTQHT